MPAAHQSMPTHTHACRAACPACLSACLPGLPITQHTHRPLPIDHSSADPCALCKQEGDCIAILKRRMPPSRHRRHSRHSRPCMGASRTGECLPVVPSHSVHLEVFNERHWRVPPYLQHTEFSNISLFMGIAVACVVVLCSEGPQ